jgi:tetratricopeptide (TPR) repeat protein
MDVQMTQRARLCDTIGRPVRICVSLVAVLWAAAGTVIAQQGPSPVRVWEDTMTLPTYEEGLPDPNPPFDYFGTSRFNYPYTIRDNLTDRRAPRLWRTLNLENEYLKCIVLPDLGGHLYSCTDKLNGAEVFYANPSIKLTQIAYRGAWAALGVEFNFPVSHNWMTTSPVDFAIGANPDSSASVWVGNIDRPYGMQWLVELRLQPGRAVLEQHTTLYNRSDYRHRFYWWTNAAVEVWDDSRIIYPMQFTASHGFRDIDTWPVDSRGTDNSVVGNHRFGPVSRFSYGSREPYMAVYHPRTQAGVVHYSSPTDLPAKKIWSWGSDPDGLDWRRALSDDNSAYVEIQAGIFRDQETYGFLEPQEVIRFSEYWVPIRHLGGVTRANPDAVIHLARGAETSGLVSLELAVNVTRTIPNATVTFKQVETETGREIEGERVVASERLTLTPATTFTARLDDLPAGATYTVEIRDPIGLVVLSHTEGVYDFTPADQIETGPQPRYSPPAGDFLALGELQQREGRRLLALATYREGLRRFPSSLQLKRSAGRLAVALKQYDAAVSYLSDVLAPVSNDREAAYYLGQALAARGDTARARLLWEASQSFGTFRPASQWALAALTAREGDLVEALEILEELTEGSPYAVRAGGLEVALLRNLGLTLEARARVSAWQRADPTSSFLRYEAARLGRADEALWCHLAADPERILELVVDYIRFGLYEDALDLLSRDYPAGPGVISEPGMPRPRDYPLIAYYRGYVKGLQGRNGGEDFERASRMPTRYVFPNRPETFAVLRAAISHNPEDATAHFLLGSLYLSGGMVDAAMEEWETARRLNPRIPVLHRNMGYTILRADGSPEEAVEIFAEGIDVDAWNVGLYFGLDEAMALAGRSASERADAMRRYPDLNEAPAALVYKLARTLAEAGRYDEAEQLFVSRFFPRKEGGINVREVYLEVRLGRAGALAEAGDCTRALEIIEHLGEYRPDLYFTRDGLEPFIESERFQGLIGEVRATCSGGV